MKINGISLIVSLNFIAIAFTAPTTWTSQVKNHAVDYKSNPLEARSLLGGLLGPGQNFSSNVIDPSDANKLGRSNSGMDSQGTKASSPPNAGVEGSPEDPLRGTVRDPIRRPLGGPQGSPQGGPLGGPSGAF